MSTGDFTGTQHDAEGVTVPETCSVPGLCPWALSLGSVLQFSEKEVGKIRMG